jgi:hypothetical protein
LGHGSCSYICMYINAVAGSVMSYLQHNSYNIIFKIKHKSYTASGPASPKRKILGAHLYHKTAFFIPVDCTQRDTAFFSPLDATECNCIFQSYIQYRIDGINKLAEWMVVEKDTTCDRRTKPSRM